MTLTNGSSAGNGLFGHGCDPELALIEVSGTKVLLLVSSVRAGAVRTPDPVRSLPSGLRPPGGGVTHPYSALAAASPGHSGGGRGQGGRARTVAARGAPCAFLRSFFGLQPPETRVGHFPI